MKEMQKSLEEVLDTITTWFKQNDMLVNASKTELIVCGDRRQLARLEVFSDYQLYGRSSSL